MRLQSPSLAMDAWGGCSSMWSLSPKPLEPRGGGRHSSPAAPRAPARRPRIRGEFVRTVRGKEHAKRHVGGQGECGNDSS